MIATEAATGTFRERPVSPKGGSTASSESSVEASMKYIPQGKDDEKELLKAIGLKSTEELFSNIPSQLRIKKPLDYPRAQSEIEIRQTFENLSKLSPVPSVSFAGCGVYSHYIPSIVPQIQGRSEFATAYTPYQPEISQGLLQAIFEYQTLACQLTECELSNASVYDGATALAEGVLMALRLKKKSEGKILVSQSIHPFYQEVLRSYCTVFEDRIQMLPLEGDVLSLKALEQNIESADVVVTQSPNIFGVIENYSAVSKLVKNSKAFWVTSTMEPFAWGVLRGPGAFGAHIVTGEGQSFGNAAYLGGSSFGIFATRNEYLRNLPGRLVGETVDQKNRRSYVLTFATREQFIRRDKATSNICTNQNLNMLAGLIHLATLGKKGFREVAVQNLSRSEYLKNKIRSETKLKVSSAATFNEFTIESREDASRIVEAGTQQGFIPGVALGSLRSEWSKKLSIHANELHDLEQMNSLVRFLKSYE
ncbi:MAG: putative glycine dehydrogenase (decarboxylating) subunit 1 [Bacteriovoracaceae bacterium]|nr:putative glycine dehydrogenase (decarboxylating) subunit 1 [Bacteriovoracaceae bacterium]